MILALFTSLALAGDFCDDTEKVEELQAELQALWEADRADHTESRDPGKLAKLDKSRSSDAYKLHTGEKLCNAQSKFYAAALMVRSEQKKVLDVAYGVAKETMLEHVHGSAWLSAVAYDRRQVSQGLMQRYGTQLNQINNKVCLYPVEEGVTDSERKTYDIPPIAETYRRVLDANGLTREAAVWESLDAHDLVCDLKVW